VKFVLTSIGKSPVRRGAGPLPVAILREEFDYNGEASFIGQLEGRFPALG
jgi:hypothetical protein